MPFKFLRGHWVNSLAPEKFEWLLETHIIAVLAFELTGQHRSRFFYTTDYLFCRHFTILQWRHNERDGISHHQPHDYLLNRLFRRRSKKTSEHRVTGLCVGNSPVTGEFPAQRVSNAANAFIWWRYHGTTEKATFDVLSTVKCSINFVQIKWYWLSSINVCDHKIIDVNDLSKTAKPTLTLQTMGAFNATDNITCARPDVRLTTEQATSCDHYVDDQHDITWEYLYPPGIWE